MTYSTSDSGESPVDTASGSGDVEDHGVVEITPDWRREALHAVMRNAVYADRDNGTGVEGCLVPRSAVDKTTDEIAEESNYYHSVLIGGQKYLNHVAMLMLIEGVPLRTGHGTESELGLHSCNNPACFAPLHLRIGNHAENMRQMVADGRSVRPLGFTPVPKGNRRQKQWTPKERTTGLSLLRKYRRQPGSDHAIAEYLGRSVWSIRSFKKYNEQLIEGAEPTEIELVIKSRGNKKNPIDTRSGMRRRARAIRLIFMNASRGDRSGLLTQLERETGFSNVWVRAILAREIYKDQDEDIPAITDFGIRRRRSYKQKPKTHLTPAEE